MTRSHLIIDIETTIDPEFSEGLDPEKVPSAPHNQVVSIGALLFNNRYEVKGLRSVGHGLDEAGMLAEFVRLVEERRPCLVTFNGRGFDLPVIASRCLRHGIPFPYYYGTRDVRYRFTTEGHFDLMDYVADFGATKTSKLDVIARVCGMPGKVGVDGKAVAQMIADGRLAEVSDYGLCDVAQTAGVFLRVQYVRGVLGRDEYLEAMRGLIAFIRDDFRVKPVAERLNEPRLLLEPVGIIAP